MFCHKHQNPVQTNGRALDSGIGIGCLKKKMFLPNLLLLSFKKAFVALFYSEAQSFLLL